MRIKERGDGRVEVKELCGKGRERGALMSSPALF